ILLARSTGATLSDLWLFPATLGAEAKPFLQTRANEACGQFSPDMNWIAYTSDESGNPQIYLQAFPSGGKWQISKDGGVQPRWRSDGKELFYRSTDGYIMAVDIRGGTSLEAGAPKKLFPAPLVAVLTETSIDYAVTADGQKFIVSRASGSAAEPMTAVLNW